MFKVPIKIGDIVKVKDESPYLHHSPLAIWHEFMGKTGVVIEISIDEVDDCSRIMLWIDGQVAEFFLDEVEELNEKALL